MKKYFLILAVLIATVMITANNCDPVCGDGTCDSGEDQSSCFEDCGNKTTPQPTPYCGDGTCNSGESCSTCSSDFLIKIRNITENLILIRNISCLI